MIADYGCINTYKLKAEYYSILYCMDHFFLHIVYNIKVEEEMMQWQTFGLIFIFIVVVF